MTKTELLETMKKYGACQEATTYVTRHPSDDASVSGAECTDVSWLIWLLGRERRLDRFVRVCALRAKKAADSCAGSRYAAARCAADDAARCAADYAVYAAAAYAYAAHCAARCADAYAADYARTQERAAQHKGLQRIWVDWCAGKEVEKLLDGDEVDGSELVEALK